MPFEWVLSVNHLEFIEMNISKTVLKLFITHQGGVQDINTVKLRVDVLYLLPAYLI